MSRSNIKYISTKLVSRKSKSAFKQRASRAMSANGYVIIAHEGWLVKKFKGGRIEKIEKLNSSEQNQTLILD